MSSEAPLRDVDKMARLARIRLSDAERDIIENDLKTILKYVAILDEVDTQAEPMAYVSGVHSVVREDVSTLQSALRAGILANAPERIEDDLIKVPAVLPGEGVAE